MRSKDLLFLAVALPVVLLDQLTKAWIVGSLQINDGYAMIDGLFNIVHVRNPGAAFGFLAGASPWFRSVFFAAVTVAAIGMILHYLRRMRDGSVPLVLSLALILAGAVGNLIDRVRFGEVVDFLDFHIGSAHWPAFNVADAAISTGAVLLAISMIAKRGRKEVR